MYHYTRDLKNSKYPNIKGLDLPLFEQQLQFFNDNFNVVKMEDVLSAFNGDNHLPDKALLLTFDDGYIDNYDVALPLLLKYGFQGSFFIPAKTFNENKILDVNKIHFILACVEIKSNITELRDDIFSLLKTYRDSYDIATDDELYEKYAIANRFDDKDTIFCKRVLQTALPKEVRNNITDILFNKYVGVNQEEFAKQLYLNKKQIQEMKQAGMFIGVHGYNHEWLGDLSKEEFIKDLDKAIEVMDEFIDKDNWVMNYPYGSYNQDVIDYISSKGCKLGLITAVRTVDIEKDNPYELPRFDCNDFPPKSERYLSFNI